MATQRRSTTAREDLPTSFAVDSGDVSLAVDVWGSSKDGPTVLLVHGYPDNSQVWHPLVAALRPGHHVVAYDVRGAGRSSQPRELAAYRLPLLAEDLVAVVDAVSPDRPIHLVAHDWGAIQSWEALCHPRLSGRITSFTVFGAPSLDHAAHWLRRCLRSRDPAQWALVARQLVHSWYVLLFHLPVVAPLAWRLGLGAHWPRVLARLEGIDAEASGTQASDGSVGVRLYRANFGPRLAKPRECVINVPVQVLLPRRDPYMLPELWDELSNWARDVTLHTLDAGHWAQLSHPREVAAYISDFIEYNVLATQSAPRRGRATTRRRRASD